MPKCLTCRALQVRHRLKPPPEALQVSGRLVTVFIEFALGSLLVNRRQLRLGAINSESKNGLWHFSAGTRAEREVVKTARFALYMSVKGDNQYNGETPGL